MIIIIACFTHGYEGIVIQNMASHCSKRGCLNICRKLLAETRLERCDGVKLQVRVIRQLQHKYVVQTVVEFKCQGGGGCAEA